MNVGPTFGSMLTVLLPRLPMGCSVVDGYTRFSGISNPLSVTSTGYSLGLLGKHIADGNSYANDVVCQTAVISRQLVQRQRFAACSIRPLSVSNGLGLFQASIFTGTEIKLLPMAALVVPVLADSDSSSNLFDGC
jgi:hypothetical protein